MCFALWCRVSCVLAVLAASAAAQTQPVEGYLPKFSRRVPRAVRERIPLSVSFPGLSGLDRLPATFGVPFPRGALKSAEHVRLVTASGSEVPCTVRRTATWERPDGDVKWLLIDTSLRKGQRYFLEYGTAVDRRSLQAKLTAVDERDEIRVDTGLLRLRFSKVRPTLVTGAALRGQVALVPGQQKPMSLVDEAGQVALASDKPEDLRVELEQAGPLHAIVKTTGWYRLPSGQKLCQYVTRVHAFAGESFVRAVHTFVVAFDTDSVRLRDVCVPLVLAGSGPAAFGVDEEAPSGSRDMTDGYLLQDRHDHFVLRSADGQTALEGRRAPGWFDMSGPACGLTVGLRHIWQEFPKELEIAGREMRVHLWPPHGTAALDFGSRATLGPERYKEWDGVYYIHFYKGGLDGFDQAMGVAKTSEMILAFYAGDRARAVSECMTLERPLVVSAGPEWMCESDVFGRLRARGASGFDNVERKMTVGFERFERLRRLLQDYGMIHYGDVHYVVNFDKELKQYSPRPWRCWASRFYGFPLVPWLMFARSGDPQYLIFGYDNARHVMDIDMCHVTNAEHKKWRGGRYGGNGGIIHYAANIYPIGCDSHVEHMLYMYYLTGYRRAWDMVMEEAEFYLDRDRRKADGHMIRYAHRMTGGGIRTMIALYRATWDERYLKIAQRLAQLCYENQDADGAIRNDDVYMAPGLFTYYQATGDRLMLDLFLRCMRKQARTALPMTDPRGYSFYGPAMAYFATEDPTYLGRAVDWMNQYAACVDESDDPLYRGQTKGHWDYCHHTVHMLYMPYLLEALANCKEPVTPTACNPVTGGEILLRQEKSGPLKVGVHWGCYDNRLTRGVPLRRWPDYCKRNNMSARVVLRDATLREVAIQPIDLTGATSGSLELTAPKAEPGVYRLAVESADSLPLKVLLTYSTTDKYVFDVSRGYVAFAKRYHFLVPEGRRKFQLRLKAQVLRSEVLVDVFDPRGVVVTKWKKDVGASPLADYATIGWDVPAGMDGKLWSVGVEPSTGVVERLYLQLDGPPYVATSPGAFFVPDAPLPAKPAPQPAHAGPASMGKALSVPAAQALCISRGEGKGEAQYERIAAKQGTIEFWLRAAWDPDELRDLNILTCGQMRAYRRSCIGTYVGMAGQVRQSGFVMGANRWYHLAIVWSPDDKARVATDTRLYVDGVSVGTLNWQAQSGLGDWTGPAIRIGSAVALEIDDLRVSDVARYAKDFGPGALPAVDGHTLVQLDFEAPLPASARLSGQ